MELIGIRKLKKNKKTVELFFNTIFSRSKHIKNDGRSENVFTYLSHSLWCNELKARENKGEKGGFEVLLDLMKELPKFRVV